MKKVILFFLTIINLLAFINITAKADVVLKDVNIISSTNITIETAKKWAKAKGATDEFIGLADLYWKYASSNGGVNPAIAYVQAAKETGYGSFSGVIDSSFHNPCGMKVTAGGADGDPNAHQRFNTWDEGVQAHLDHLALYAGANGYPRSKTFDPRHFSSIFGTAKTVIALGSKWAPSQTYGNEMLTLYYQLNDLQNGGNKPGWNLKNGHWYYYDENLIKVTGWKNIDGLWYYLDKESIMQTGFITIENKKYYLADNGVMKTGWQWINGNWYYFAVNGEMKTGFINPDNRTFYLDENGVMQTGWKLINGKSYYFAANGEMKTGIVKDGARTFYIDSEGNLAKGWKQIVGRWYYFDTINGDMKIGFIKPDYRTFYLDENGVMQTGWKWINGKWYYFDMNGEMKKGLIDVDNRKFIMSEDGTMQTGWQNIEGKYYYFDTNGEMCKGWKNIDGYYYYLKSSGEMATGWITSNNLNYYLNSSGIMETGWTWINGNWYYLHVSGMKMTGWQSIDGYWYYLDPSTGMVKGWLDLNGIKYYFSDSGRMQTGWCLINNDWYYFQPWGEMAKNTTIDGYALDSQGKMYKKRIIVIDPGHNYGGDDGAYALFGSTRYIERDLNMQLALKLKAEFEKLGATVILTRQESDRSTDSSKDSLQNRVDIANKANADLFISLHHDSNQKQDSTGKLIPNESVTGISVHYSTYKPGIDTSGINENGEDPNGWYHGVNIDTTPSKEAIISRDLANKLAVGLSSQLGYANRNAHDHNLFVTVNTNMPAVLIENGYITNQSEAQRCSDPNQQIIKAQVIAKIVNDYFLLNN